MPRPRPQYDGTPKEITTRQERWRWACVPSPVRSFAVIFFMRQRDNRRMTRCRIARQGRKNCRITGPRTRARRALRQRQVQRADYCVRQIRPAASSEIRHCPIFRTKFPSIMSWIDAFSRQICHLSYRPSAHRPAAGVQHHPAIRCATNAWIADRLGATKKTTIEA